MADPKTKTVLGRVFTWSSTVGEWQCELRENRVLALRQRYDESRLDSWMVELTDELDEVSLGADYGPTESDAILALQSTLRKMALLEVER